MMYPLKYKILPLIQPKEDRSPIDRQKIKDFLGEGLSEYPDLDRTIAWLVSLKLYPDNPERWCDERCITLKKYDDLVAKYELRDWVNIIFQKKTRLSDFKVDNPEMMQLIHFDVLRTSRSIYFLPPEQMDSGANEVSLFYLKHMRRIERILYLFSIQFEYHYTQGFNELVFPLYYVFAKGIEFFDDDIYIVEAFTYFAFDTLLSKTGLNMLYDSTNDNIKVHKQLRRFDDLISEILPKTFKIFQTLQIVPLYYAYRWFTILFTQEYELPNILLLWDYFFSKFEDIINVAYIYGIAQLKCIEEQLTEVSLSNSLKLIQNLKEMNICNIIKDAKILYCEHRHLLNGKEKKNILDIFKKDG